MSLVGQKPRALAGAVLVAFAMVASVSAPSAPAAVYWGDVKGVAAANLDGSEIDFNLFSPNVQFSWVTCVIGLTESDLYWRGYSGIWRVNRDGPAVPTEVVPGAGRDCGAAVGEGYVYWSDSSTNAIGRAALDGSGRVDSLISGLANPCGVAVVGGYVYWSEQIGIGRAKLDGSEVERGFVPSATSCSLAVDGEYLYWAGYERIGRVRTDGTGVEPEFIAALDRISGVAAYGGTVYWAERSLESTGPAEIGRRVAGSAPERGWIVTGVHEAHGLVIDGKPLIARRSLRSHSFRFGQVRRNLRRGTAVLDVWVPTRGELELLSPKIGWVVDKGPEPPPWREGIFRWRLRLWPGKRGKASKRVRRLLAREGRAPLRLRLAYNEVGQLPVRRTKRLALRKKIRKRKRSVRRHGYRAAGD